MSLANSRIMTCLLLFPFNVILINRTPRRMEECKAEDNNQEEIKDDWYSDGTNQQCRMQSALYV